MTLKNVISQYLRKVTRSIYQGSTTASVASIEAMTRNMTKATVTTTMKQLDVTTPS